MRDDEAFTRFVMQAYPGLLRRAFLLVGDHGRAEDLVQTSLASAYGRWGRIRQPEAYLRTVMTRHAVRWGARRWNREYPTGNLPERSVGAGTPADVDLSVAVQRALMSLPVEQRAVVVQRYFDGCTEAEIAKALRCSPGTVKSRSSRALAALRASGMLDG